MFFPKLFDLAWGQHAKRYTADVIAKVDDYLGSLVKGSSFSESDLNHSIGDVLLTDQLLIDLVEIGLIKEDDDDTYLFEENVSDDIDRQFSLIVEPSKKGDSDYVEYLRKKRQIDSFSIIYEKTKQKKSGALTLIDLKGYSKNINNDRTNAAVLLLIEHLQKTIDDCLRPYFLNHYSGIEIKHNGDGWFLYFLNELESLTFLEQVLSKALHDSGLKKEFDQLETSLKCYIHHTDEIEKIYKVDTLHFDMEGRDVILIHLLEKPIEKKLYSGILNATSSFLAITDSVYSKLPDPVQHSFSALPNLELDIKDAEGYSKLHQLDIKIYFKAYN